MTRPRGGWVPDGRAKALRHDCEASLAALGGLPIDLYLIHAPDPRTPWRTSVRALARLRDEGLVRHVGVSNVNRRQLDEALEFGGPIAAVEVALGPHDDRALRGGIVERCDELQIAVIAHSPLGGPRRAGALARRGPLAEIAQKLGATPAEVALAWLLDLSPVVVPIPGARRPQTARSAAGAAALVLDPGSRTVLRGAFGGLRAPREELPPSTSTDDGDVVLVMGIPGAGKGLVADEYVARGYVRLNRDERGGTLRDLADALDGELSSGVRRIVLDNTYLTRAARSHVIDTANRHGVSARCVWLDTPLAQAQVNLVERMLERFGALPAPDELRRLTRRQPGVLAPTSQMRTVRELEPPSIDEGFAGVETIAFLRRPAPNNERAGVFVAAAALRVEDWERALAQADRRAPHLLFDWSPGGTPESLAPDLARLAAAIDGPAEAALCPHAGGPPTCWCRPPLPGLPLAFARSHGLDPARSILIGTGPAHRNLAAALGARYIPV
jgi:diketogulonate reductase-like aldo/keto reductase